MEIIGKTISYSCVKKKETDKREKEIINEINRLEECLNPDNVDLLNTLNEELVIIRRKKNGRPFYKISCQVYRRRRKTF